MNQFNEIKNIFHIKDIGDGWYNFQEIPQESCYIKIHNLNCGTSRKARSQALKILKNNGFSEQYIKESDFVVVHEVLRK